MDELYGWWGELRIIKGVSRMKWIGPMTETEMKQKHETYRHNFSPSDPKKQEAARLRKLGREKQARYRVRKAARDAKSRAMTSTR